MLGLRLGSTGPRLTLRFAARKLGALLFALGLPACALAATTPVTIDLGTSVDALSIITSNQPGCGLPPPPSLFGPGPETYSYGQTTVTSGAGNHVLELVDLSMPGGVPTDPAILIYAGAFDPADPATNLLACDDNGNVDPALPPTFPRLVVSANTLYTVVVIVPEDPALAPGTATATLSSAPEPTITFADRSITLGTVGESMTATSNSTGTISYVLFDPSVAAIDPGTGEITTFATGSTPVAALQARDGGTFGSGFREATLTVTAAAPTVTGIVPASGSTTGGTAVTISGTDFSGATAVTIGGIAATDVAVVNATTITATAPAGTAGARDVTVTTPAGTGTGTGLFTYVAVTRLAFTTQPAGAVAGAAFTTQPKVSIQDENGVTLTSSTATVTLAIKAGTGAAGAALQNCAAVAAVAGVANFSGCGIDLAGTDYVLTASATGATSGESAAFAVAAAPTAVSAVDVYVSPATANAAATMTVQFTPTTALVAADTITVRLIGYTFPSGAVSITNGIGIIGTLVGNVDAGALDTVVVTGGAVTAGAQAQFAFPVTNPAAGTIAKAGLTVATSKDTVAVASASDIVITVPPNRLVFTTQPAGAVAGAAFTTQPVVTIQDASGVTDTSSTATVSLMIKTGTGSAGAVLQSCSATAAVSGVATFTGCAIDRAGTSYVLIASATGATSGESAAFAVAAAPTAVSAVDVSVSPATANAATTMTVQFTPTTALVAADTITVRLIGYTFPSGAVSITNGTGITGTLVGNVNAGALDTVVVTGGAVAAGTQARFTFPVTNPAAGTIAKAGLTVATSKDTVAVASASDIVITAPIAPRLVFTTQPSGAVVATAFTTQPRVTIQDANGVTQTSSTAVVTLAKKSGTGTLSCNAMAVAAVSGVATFSGCKIDVVTTDFVMTASSAGLTSVDSPPITVHAPSGAATKLIFARSPPTTLEAGERFSLRIAVQDADGTLVSRYNGSVTITTPSNADASKLKGSLTATFIDGVATLSGLYFTEASSQSYSLVASAAGLSSAQSSSIIVSRPTRASYIAFTSVPSFEATGVAFSSQPVVRAFATDRKVFTSQTGSVTLSARAAPGTTGTPVVDTSSGSAGLTQPLSAGVASFSGVRVTAPAGSYILEATLVAPSSPANGFSAETRFNVYATAVAAATARATEQASSNTFTLNFKIDDVYAPATSSIKADLCKALSLNTAAQCARVIVNALRESTSTSLGAASSKATAAAKGTCPAEVTAVGEVTVPPCIYSTPGTYRLVGTSPGFPARTSNPFTVVDTLDGNLPGAPGNIRVQVGDGQAVVRWDPPASAGAGRIVSYEVFGLRDGIADQSLAKGLLTSKTLRLANGSEWRFGVVAHNALGGGEMATSEPVRIGAAPAATKVSRMTPQALAPGRIDGQCGVAAGRVSVLEPTEGLCASGTVDGSAFARRGSWAWTCDGAHGGSPAHCATAVTAGVVGVGASPNAAPATRDADKLDVAGCTVQRAETVGVGPEQGPGTGAVMPYGAAGLELTDCPAGSASVTISYPIVVQDMQLYTQLDGRWNMLPVDSPGLAIIGDTATFEVADNGPVDADPQVGVISVVAGVGYIEAWLPELPEAPQNVTASAGSSSITVSWTAPTSGGPVVRYQVVAFPGGASCIAEAPATSCTVTGLTPGVSYTFTVIAENGAGGSPASAPSAASYAIFRDGFEDPAPPGAKFAKVIPLAGVGSGFDTLDLADYDEALDANAWAAVILVDGASEMVAAFELRRRANVEVRLALLEAKGWRYGAWTPAAADALISLRWLSLDGAQVDVLGVEGAFHGAVLSAPR